LKRFLLLTLPVLFSFSTCGHRGAPLPPLTKEPSAPKIKVLVQDFNRPLLSWESVKTYRDGRKLPDPKKVKYIININFGKEKAETSETYFIDSPIEVGEKRCYSVSAVYEGKQSSPSEPVCLVGEKPLNGVPEVKVKGEDGRVVVKLKNPGFSVEVFKNQKFPYVEPYAVFKGDEFIDRKVKNGKTYTYRFRFSKGKLKGRLTEPITVTPQDRIPPLPPPHAYLIEGKECTVVWDPSPSKDVIYYVVKTGNGIFKTSGIYLNLPKCPKKVEITAVDKAGNRSEPVSAEVVR